MHDTPNSHTADSNSLDIHIYIRRTLQWDNEAAVMAEIRDDLKPNVQLWNSLFNIPYHLFRHRVKLIAQANLEQVKNVSITNAEQVPQGAMIVPVDDDDWFSPDLATHLRKAYDDTMCG